MAIPLMLITLGVAVARLHPRALCPALRAVAGQDCDLRRHRAGACGRAFGLPDRWPFAVLVLQVATPVAVTSYLLAEKYSDDADAVAGLVVVSTLMSVIALPLTLAFLV